MCLGGVGGYAWVEGGREKNGEKKGEEGEDGCSTDLDG